MEWGYKEITNQRRYLDFKNSVKILEVPVDKYYIVAAFMCNLRFLFNVNQTSDYFACKKMSLEEYLVLID